MILTSTEKALFRLSFVTSFVMLLLLLSCGEKEKNDTKHEYTNALINETSPYLLQHAHNPVDWRPWSQEALEDAKKQKKLVLISIGYSSCHWCHVMEEETFENDSIAKIMNENFVNIKVDREERPDVDQVYMTAIQLMKGNGGWPLNVITLPNGKPLYAGTYHTKNQWEQVISRISKLYKEDPEKAGEYSDMVAAGIQQVNLIEPSNDFENLNRETLTESVNKWKSLWDLEWGGDKRQEKFIIPVNLDFLLDYALLSKDEATLKHTELTLDKIAFGGIYDHVGGGFFRYSTDPEWKVPHFEKMLYDNAQLLSLYSKAYKVFKKEDYKKIALGIAQFLEREMKNPEGGYYAALDADSEGEEGKYYVWKKEELKSILGDDFQLFASYYNINPKALWEKKIYILHRLTDDKSFVSDNGLSESDFKILRKNWQEKLLKARQKRIRPRKDDKIITSWNALLVKGYTDAYTAFGNDQFLDRAKSLLRFIQEKSYTNNALKHSYKQGSKHIEGFLEDYSFLADASLQLFSVTMDKSYLEFAQNLTETIKKDFADEASGMYTYNKNRELISKIIKTDDGTLPSPNAVMAHNLFRLGHIFYDVDNIDKAKKMLSSVSGLAKENPFSYGKWNSLMLNTTYPFYEIAIVGKKAQDLLNKMNTNSIPNTLIVASKEESDTALFKGRYVTNETFIYVCRDNACKLPVDNVESAIEQLENF